MLRRLLPWLLLALALLFVYAPLLAHGDAYRNGDLGDCTIPLLNWQAGHWSGMWSEIRDPSPMGLPSPWNPYVLGGRPGIVDGGVYTGYYPPTAWYLYQGQEVEGPVRRSAFFAVSSVLHCLWAGWGMLLLLRLLGRSGQAALCGALVFAAGGFCSARLFAGQYPHISSAAWTPWVFWTALRLQQRRRWCDTLPLGLALAMQFFAGLPQFVAITLCGLPVLWLPRRWRQANWRDAVAAGLRLLPALLIFLLLAAPDIVPLAELLQHSQRRAGLAADDAMRDSLAPGRWGSLWLPLTTINPFDQAALPRLTEFWETSLFIGWSPWLLLVFALAAGLGRRGAVWRWFALAGAAVLLAAGPHLPLYPLLWKIVPGFTMLRSPGRWLLLAALAAAVITACAFDRVRARWPRRRRLLAWLPALLTLELAWLAWTLLAPAYPYAVGAPYWTEPNRISEWLAARASADVREHTDWRGRWRIVALADFPLLNETLYTGLESCNGYLGVVPQRYYDLVRLHDERVQTATPLYFFRADNPAFRLLNVRYIVTRAALEQTDTRWQAPVFSDGEAKVYELPWPAPRMWVPRSYRACRDDSEVLQALARPDFDPLTGAVGVGGEDYTLAASDTVAVWSQMRNTVSIIAPRSVVLVFSEHYLPEWIVDRYGPAFPVNHALLGVRVPAGRSWVQLEYPRPIAPIIELLHLLFLVLTIVAALAVLARDAGRKNVV